MKNLFIDEKYNNSSKLVINIFEMRIIEFVQNSILLRKLIEAIFK